MKSEKKPSSKTRLHPRNKNQSKYDLEALIHVVPPLHHYLKPNKVGETSVDFSNPKAVKLLNAAILNHYYGIQYWEFPDENLCPPIPGRADYIHHVADLLGNNNFGRIPTGDQVSCLDIGVGASCIYPLIGTKTYHWKFTGTDISEKSIESAKRIIKANGLSNKVACELQPNATSVFEGIIAQDECFDLSICNPPFHATAAEALKGTSRKLKNLGGKHPEKTTLNFSGVNDELICEGGEYQFIKNMIEESQHFSQNVYWFSTLVSKKSNLKNLYQLLKKVNAIQVETIAMGTSNKATRIVAWTFLKKDEQKAWKLARWKSA